jgi:hypothetical protein
MGTISTRVLAMCVVRKISESIESSREVASVLLVTDSRLDHTSSIGIYSIPPPAAAALTPFYE